MKFCGQCGGQIADDARFCEHCGAKVEDGYEQEEYGQQAEEEAYEQAGTGLKKGIVLITLIVLLVALAACSVTYLLLSRRDHKAARDSSGIKTQKAAKAENDMDFDELEGILSGQEASELSFVSADVSEFPKVKLYVRCEDASGQSLTLSSPTAKIKETVAGGKEIERKIKKIEQLKGNQGLGVELLTDKSGSMSSDLPTMQRVMTEFIDSLDYDSGDKVEIISFDSFVMYMCDYTNDKARLKNGIANMTAYGDTALYNALVTGIQNAGARPGANCVIAFTDGVDNVSTYTYKEAVNLALQNEIPVYIIGTSGADQTTLSELALETGGRYWNANAIVDIAEIYEEIYANQKDMYCIEYETDADSDAYAKRIISCILKDGTYGGIFKDQEFAAVEKQEVQKHASRYEIVREDISWTQANEKARAKGGHLVTITSADEEQQMEKLASDNGVKYCWIGGYTSVRDNQAFGHWTTGEAFDYTNWFAGEPSRNDKDGTPEFYLMLWNVQGAWSWNDQRDDVVNSGLDYFKGNVGYIIEYEQ